MKAQELRDKSVEELYALLDDTRSGLYHLVNEKKMSAKVEKPHLLKIMKKDVAKLLTIIKEKQVKEAGA